MEDLSVVRFEKTRKIKDLQLDEKYYVKGYKPLNTKYGSKYIVTIDDFDDLKNLVQGTSYEMWATKAIVKFITKHNLRPNDKFSFKVNYCGQFGYYAENFILNDYRM